MKFYRVRYSCEGGNSAGYSWHTSQAAALKAAKEAVENDPEEYRQDRSGFPEMEEIEIENTKKGILSALTLYAGHADNG